MRFQSAVIEVEEWWGHSSQSVEETAEVGFPSQSVKQWWCGDRGGRVAGPFPVVRDIRDQIWEQWNEHRKAKSSISENSIISDLVLTLAACFQHTDTHSI